MFVEDAILLSFAITVISEIAVILAIQRPPKAWQWALGVFLINTFTHPLVMYFLKVGDASYVAVELGVFLVELLFYRLAFGASWSRSAVLSGAANIVSILAGVFVRTLDFIPPGGIIGV